MDHRRTFGLQRRYDVTFGLRLPEQLGYDLDLLPSTEQEIEGNTSHSSHLDVIDEAHELVHQPLRKICILQAVDGKTAPGLGVTVL